MKRSSADTDKRLHRFLGRYGNPPESQVESEIERAWQQLQKKVPLPDGIPAHSMRSPWLFPRLAGAMAVVAVVAGAIVVAMNPFAAPDTRAGVESGSGQLQASDSIPFGKVIRSREDVSALTLPDGSRIEMRPESELVLENADGGVRIRLNVGSVIVTAVEQRTGHLYVQTKDLTVSVVGTVFMVNAREEGSRVAVIQGEVQVRQGETSKTLLPGDQVATGISMQTLPVAAEISWSKHAPAHLALLQQNTSNRIAAPIRLEFAATSIKSNDPNVPLTSGGFGCRGIDGRQWASFGERGEPTLVVPMGRCVGNGVVMSQMIALAYGIPHRFGPNAPDWAAAGTPTDLEGPAEGPQGGGRIMRFRTLIRERFQIDAVADKPAIVTTEELRQMVQTMLADRFKLTSHRSTEEAPGYVLAVGSSAPRLKQVMGDETPLDVDMSNPGGPVLRGRSTVDEFLVFLMGFSNPAGFIEGELPSYIVNKTGLTGIYEWEFALPTSAVGGGGRGGGAPLAPPNPDAVFVQQSPSKRYSWRGPALADAVEKQLGLQMQPQLVPVEVLVIDSVEKPSPN
jgi:uncharacterized protein (TIGR03435 family)